MKSHKQFDFGSVKSSKKNRDLCWGAIKEQEEKEGHGEGGQNDT